MIIYADTSALAKLLIDEEGSAEFAAAVDAADGIATASISRVETFAALAAARREGRLDEVARNDAKGAAADLFANIGLVDVDASLLDRACDLAENHALRAYDAIQLSALLAMDEDDNLVFACFDGELRAAATTEGFELYPPEPAQDAGGENQ